MFDLYCVSCSTRQYLKGNYDIINNGFSVQLSSAARAVYGVDSVVVELVQWEETHTRSKRDTVCDNSIYYHTLSYRSGQLWDYF